MHHVALWLAAMALAAAALSAQCIGWRLKLALAAGLSAAAHGGWL
jgi:hypothetical protein